jgi:hypothetical protein
MPGAGAGGAPGGPAPGSGNQGQPNAGGASGTAAIVRAQIVFLLTTFTEDSFDKAAGEIRTVRVFFIFLVAFLKESERNARSNVELARVRPTNTFLCPARDQSQVWFFMFCFCVLSCLVC